MKTDKTHFLTLDGYRGVAALIVVIYHMDPFYPKWLLSIEMPSYLAVDLFFLLSGVVVARSYGAKLAATMTAWQFVKIRLVRLYPLYLLGTLIGLVTAILTPGSVDIPRALLLAFFYLPWIGAESFFPLNGPAWSLSMELISNFWYVFYCKVTSSSLLRNAIMAGAIMAIVLALRIGMPLSFGWQSAYWRGVDFGLIGGLSRVMWSFVVGVVLWNSMRPSTSRVSNGLIWGLLIAVCVVLLAPTHYRRAADLITVTALFPILVWAGIKYSPTGWTAAVCKFLGRISYPLYCIHFPLSLLAIRLGYHPNVFVIVGAIVIVAWGCEVLYDVPVRRLLGQWHPMRSYIASVKPT